MSKKFENIYYTGGSYTMIYQIGVTSYLSRKYDIHKIKWYGCSAGSLAIVLMFLLPPEKILQYYLDIVDDMKKLIETNSFDLNNYNLTDRHFAALQVIHKTDPEAYKKVSGKVNIGVTTPSGFVWYNTFSSNQELFNVLLCGFHVPVLCKYKARINGHKCMDGGFGMDHCLNLPKNTLIICPRVDKHAQLNGHMPDKYTVIPPPLTEIYNYYDKGRKDIRNYIKYGKTSGRVLYAGPNELSIPESVWRFIRNIQPEDENYSVEIFK